MKIRLGSFKRLDVITKPTQRCITETTEQSPNNPRVMVMVNNKTIWSPKTDSTRAALTTRHLLVLKFRQSILLEGFTAM